MNSTETENAVDAVCEHWTGHIYHHVGFVGRERDEMLRTKVCTACTLGHVGAAPDSLSEARQTCT